MLALNKTVVCCGFVLLWGGGEMSREGVGLQMKRKDGKAE